MILHKRKEFTGIFKKRKDDIAVYEIKPARHCIFVGQPCFISIVTISKTMISD